MLMYILAYNKFQKANKFVFKTKKSCGFHNGYRVARKENQMLVKNISDRLNLKL